MDRIKMDGIQDKRDMLEKFTFIFNDRFFVGMPGQNLSLIHGHLHTGARERRREWGEQIRRRRKKENEREENVKSLPTSFNIMAHYG